jgi:hypothetical protein
VTVQLVLQRNSSECEVRSKRRDRLAVYVKYYRNDCSCRALRIRYDSEFVMECEVKGLSETKYIPF